jgi:hypothetical protein
VSEPTFPHPSGPGGVGNAMTPLTIPGPEVRLTRNGTDPAQATGMPLNDVRN